MNFQNKLNLLFDELDCTNTDIAARAGIHPSGVSRFRTGRRTPTPKSGQLMGICAGLAGYAAETGRQQMLCELCGLDVPAGQEALAGQLYGWLYEGSLLYKPRPPRQEAHFLEDSPGRFFAQKLNLAMGALEISNSRMAEALHVNASVVSRLRNRVRQPTSDATVRAICGVLYQKAAATGRLGALASASGLPAELMQDKEPALKALFEWIADTEPSEDSRMMEGFLGQMDRFTPEAFPPLPPLDAIAPPAVLEDTAAVYNGIAGLRKAVVRFLGGAAKLEQPVTLMLYSDQGMEWMTGEAEYRKVWAALMVYTLRAKNRIRIIHNVDRSLPEMVRAFEGWIPLYMSGLLEAHAHKREAGGRFTNTLFIAPGQGAVVAAFPCGMDDEAEYRYVTGDEVAYYVRQHEALTAASTPIARVFPPGDTEGLLLLQREMAAGPGELCKVLSAPSIETMSEATLQKILERAAPGEEERRRIEAFHAKKRQLHALALGAGRVREYVYLPVVFPEAAIPLNMGELFLPLALGYTEEEYAAHLEDMRALARQKPAYSFVGLSESMFDNLQIIVKPEVGGLILKSGLATVLSSYWHPLMANAFYGYVTGLMQGDAGVGKGWN